jgi:UDP-MurNAc hydroxylase
MDITFLGQAGLFISTRAGSTLCDPWFTPAYFASWLPFPANDNVDPRLIGKQPTSMYRTYTEIISSLVFAHRAAL